MKRRLAPLQEIGLRLWRWRAPPEIRFIVFAQGRSGSTLLTDSLDSHPEIACAGEILGFRRADPVAFVEDHARFSGRPAFGFHLKIGHIRRTQRRDDPGAFLAGMHDRGWKIVHLVRRNLAAGVVSRLFAERARYYHTTSDRAYDPGVFRVDPEDFLRRMGNRLTTIEAETRALGTLPRFGIGYEADLIDPARRQEALFELQDFLGVPRHRTRTALKKSVSRPFWDYIENAPEVQAAIRRKGWAHHAGLDAADPLKGESNAANRARLG